MVKFVSANDQGLRDENKQKETFLYYKKMGFDVILIQETHSDNESELQWTKQWNGKAIFSHGDSKSRGTAILFNPKLNVEVISTTCDENGRYVIVDCKINNKEIMVTSLYAPK